MRKTIFFVFCIVLPMFMNFGIQLPVNALTSNLVTLERMELEYQEFINDGEEDNSSTISKTSGRYMYSGERESDGLSLLIKDIYQTTIRITDSFLKWLIAPSFLIFIMGATMFLSNKKKYLGETTARSLMFIGVSMVSVPVVLSVIAEILYALFGY